MPSDDNQYANYRGASGLNYGNGLPQPVRAPAPEGQSADERFARISREQFNYAQDRFAPVLDEMLNTVDDPGFARERIDMAGDSATRAYSNATGTQERTLERYGANVSSGMRTSLDRSADLGRGLAEVGARNNARDSLSDIREQTRMDLIGVGRSMSRDAQGLASGIANREQQREAASEQIDAQNDARQMQAIGTIIGMGAMMMGSSRDWKHVDGPADPDALARELEGLMLHRFRYTADMGMPGDYVGLIAEETPALFQGPDGKTVNAYNLISALIASSQQKSEQIAALEARLDRLEQEVSNG